MLKGSWALRTSSDLYLWTVSDSPEELGEHTQAKPSLQPRAPQVMLRCTQVGEPLRSEHVRVGRSGRLGDQGQLTSPRLLGPRARKENKYFCIGFNFEALPPISLCWNFTPHKLLLPHSRDEETFKDRKPLDRGHVGSEPQICLPPDPGCGTQSWCFFCDPNTHKEHQRGLSRSSFR